MRALTFIVALAVLSGCNEPGAREYGYGASPTTAVTDTLLSSDAPDYKVGKLITVRLTNRLARPLGYNLCRSRLERQDGEDQWVTIMQSLAQQCTAEIRTLRPREGVTFTFGPEGRIKPGQYRVVTDIEDFPARTRFAAVSNTFRISRDGD